MTKNLDSAMEEYDKYFKMMNVNEFLFSFYQILQMNK